MLAALRQQTLCKQLDTSLLSGSKQATKEKLEETTGSRMGYRAEEANLKIELC